MMRPLAGDNFLGLRRWPRSGVQRGGGAPSSRASFRVRTERDPRELAVEHDVLALVVQENRVRRKPVPMFMLGGAGMRRPKPRLLQRGRSRNVFHRGECLAVVPRGVHVDALRADKGQHDARSKAAQSRGCHHQKNSFACPGFVRFGPADREEASRRQLRLTSCDEGAEQLASGALIRLLTPLWLVFHRSRDAAIGAWYAVRL